MTLYIVLGILVLLAVVLLLHYNGLVAVRNHCEEAWANIDTELKRRHDLIPNLVSTVKGFAAHEKEILTRITELRESCTRMPHGTAEHARGEGELGSALKSLMVRLEAYPDLQAGANFQQLQQELVNTEDRIQAALRFYNGNVRENNAKVEMFPSNLVASMGGFTKRDYFQIEGSEFRNNPKVAF